MSDRIVTTTTSRADRPLSAAATPPAARTGLTALAALATLAVLAALATLMALAQAGVSLTQLVTTGLTLINGPLVDGPLLDLGGLLNGLQLGQFQQ